MKMKSARLKATVERKYPRNKDKGKIRKKKCTLPTDKLADGRSNVTIHQNAECKKIIEANGENKKIKGEE